VVDLPARRGERGVQGGAAGGVLLALAVGVAVVGQRGRHRGLDRCWHHHPGVPADLQQRRDQGGVAGDEARPVAGHVRALGQ
jgi:hypothetical protein